MGCYYTLCHNTYAYSLLFYKFYIRRENAGSWNSGLEKEQILETYSAQPQKSWNSTEVIFGNNKKYWAKRIPEGAHTLATRVEGAPYPLGALPASWAHGSPPTLIPAPTHFFFLPQTRISSSSTSSSSFCCDFQSPCSKHLSQNCLGGLFVGIWLLHWSN